jgi:hypothetical protein
MPTNEELFSAIQFHAEKKIPDEMRRTAFLINARRALRNGNTELLYRYLERVRPQVRGGGKILHKKYPSCF